MPIDRRFGPTILQSPISFTLTSSANPLEVAAVLDELAERTKRVEWRLATAVMTADDDVERQASSFLSAIAEKSGSRRLRHAANVIHALPSKGQKPINDTDALSAIKELMARGISQAVAIATVGNRNAAGSSTRHRWRRKIREKSAGLMTI